MKLENKSGQGVQFNWIYVAVAGAIILGFFLWFTVRYIDIQEKKLDAKVARSIDSTVLSLRGAEQFKPLDISQDFDFRFSCDAVSVNSKHTQKIADKIIFSDDNIKESRLYFWTYGFETGFYVDNFVYIIDPKQKFFLVYDSSSRDFVYRLYNAIPSGMQSLFSVIDFFGAESIKLGKNKIVVFFNPTLSQIEELQGKGDLIRIEPKEYGDATFYEGTKLESTSFFGDALIYGAVFSGSFGSYKCSRDKALDKVYVISSIYLDKADRLTRNSATLCDYSRIKTLLKTLGDSAKADNAGNLYGVVRPLVLENTALYDMACEGVF